jgi:hypothetical protein
VPNLVIPKLALNVIFGRVQSVWLCFAFSRAEFVRFGYFFTDIAPSILKEEFSVGQVPDLPGPKK